jgi:hypothetical protein
MTQEGETVFTARRALWATLLNFLLGAALAALTIANVVHQIQRDGSLAVAAMFSILALFFLWQAWTQLSRRTPVIEVGPAGLRLAGVSEEILPWTRIVYVQRGSGLPGLGGGRIDFTVDAETYARLKLGQRFMGDLVVKARGRPNTFSVITPQLEENANAIFTAVKRYWPATTTDDREE